MDELRDYVRTLALARVVMAPQHMSEGGRARYAEATLTALGLTYQMVPTATLYKSPVELQRMAFELVAWGFNGAPKEDQPDWFEEKKR